MCVVRSKHLVLIIPLHNVETLLGSKIFVETAGTAEIILSSLAN